MFSTFQHQFDPGKLPEDYVTRKFYEYGYKVKQQGSNYCCCCPVCREGNSWGKKQRCWWLVKRNLIYCFNCGHGFSPFNWIKTVSGLSGSEIRKEVQGGNYDIIDLDAVDRKEQYEIDYTPFDVDSLPSDPIDLYNNLQLEYYHGNSVVQKCLSYISERRLDTAVNAPEHLYLSLTDHIHKYRLVFPFYDAYNNVSFYQSRSFGGNPDPTDEREKIRYMGKVGATKTIFNFNKIDNSICNVYVFEGPIDCCFVKNGIAVAGISAGEKVDFTPDQSDQINSLSLLHELVWVLDSQWIDNTSLEKTKKLLELGEKVFIWPENYGRKYKDFNEMAVDMKLDEIPQYLLEQNIASSLDDYMNIYNTIKGEEEKDSLTQDENVWSADLSSFLTASCS